MKTDEVMDLIPVKPIGEEEITIKNIYTEKLLAVYGKIKPERMILSDPIN